MSSDGRVRSVLSCQDCSNDTVVEYVFDEILSCMVCPECGVCQPFFETTTGTMSQTNQRMEMTSFGYEPILHFRERLTYTQAKEQHRVPDKIVTDVMAVLAQDFTHSRALQPKDTMRALNKLKLPHYYRNNPQIFCRITGTKPPRLTRADERRYLDLFRQLIRPYDQCKGDRTNFMSYPYALYRISERLGHKEFLPFCLLFKTYKHLKKTDDIFANMCRMLGWDTDQFALYAPGNNTRHVPAHHAKKRPRTSSTAPRGASKKQKHSGQGSNL